MTRKPHIWTYEDAAFAAAQWASGISQQKIAIIFGKGNQSRVSTEIREFVRKYSPGHTSTDASMSRLTHISRAEIKGALANFVRQRAAT